MHTQEIRLDPVLLMNFYTNEELSKHCLNGLIYLKISESGMSFMEHLCEK